ncbi:uncharacterized protein LOC111622020 [Centruroides sculpturatus]|uniref:uncharacterized protein LOC111622020 n=1 Tax=Centruroides sculpturatus TaxID=218467 RepID=UPI000C6E03EE|nr:uncharacterized protein LOC111622020 [Centruroides sculpturatus]
MSEVISADFEGIGGEFNRQRKDNSDYCEKIEELKYFNKKLQEENERLSLQISHADDSQNVIAKENELLKRKIESTHLLDLNIKELQSDYDDMKELLQVIKEENNELKLNFSESEKERIFFKMESEKFQKKLQQAEEYAKYLKEEKERLLFIIAEQEKFLSEAKDSKLKLKEEIKMGEEKNYEQLNHLNPREQPC